MYAAFPTNRCRTFAGQVGFHTVGPVYRDGKHGEPDLLARCSRACFALAQQYKARSISFPEIGTGVYGYPLASAAAIAVREAQLWPNLGIVYILFSEEAYRVFTQAGGPSGPASC